MLASISAPPKFLQDRSAADLGRGLKIKAYEGTPPDQASDPTTPKPTPIGKDWADLAVARLIQDGANFVAGEANVKPSLNRVFVNDAESDKLGAAGYAFLDNKGGGGFSLSNTSTRDLFEGISLLQKQPYETWTAQQQGGFAEGISTVLHELGHITLPAYDKKTRTSWDRHWDLNHGIEEGLTELSSAEQLPRFMKQEFGVDLPAQTADTIKNTAAYTRWTARLTELHDLAGIDDPAAVAAAARKIGDATYPGSRNGTMARAIADRIGGPDAPAELVKDIRTNIPYYSHEISGSRTKLRLALQALEDHQRGNPIDWERYRADRAKMDASIKSAWEKFKDNPW